ncbi:MAG: hypothetical protein SR1Q5_02550 [Quinella sp. 1Q5]|nr:hypothetical protein [Quinella sp. 1Q5]
MSSHAAFGGKPLDRRRAEESERLNLSKSFLCRLIVTVDDCAEGFDSLGNLRNVGVRYLV